MKLWQIDHIKEKLNETQTSDSMNNLNNGIHDRRKKYKTLINFFVTIINGLKNKQN